MANANETGEEEDLETPEEEEDLDLEEEEGSGEDAKAEKTKKGEEGDKTQRQKETPDQKRSRLQRELKQHDKKFPPEKKAVKESEKNSEFGLTELSYLKTHGVDDDNEDEVGLVQSVMRETGKDLKSVLKLEYFKSELKGLREDRAAADAIPKSRRTGNVSPNSVEYWIAKGELPPNTPENRELRGKVVKAKMASSKAGSQFTSNPVIGG